MSLELPDSLRQFEFEGAIIRPLTPEGRVTVKILRLNDEDRLLERSYLMETGLYGLWI